MLKRLRQFWKDERGATSIEYVMIAGLMSILIVAGVTGIGKNLTNKFYGPVQAGLS